MRQHGRFRLVCVLALGVALATCATRARAADKDATEKPEAPRTDLYGDPLPPGAVARMGTVRFRPGDRVNCLTYSPDGKILASVGWESGVCLWDAASGKLLRRLGEHAFAVAFS